MLSKLLRDNEAAEDVIVEKLYALNISGAPVNKIRSWTYFEPAIEEALERARQMSEGFEP